MKLKSKLIIISAIFSISSLLLLSGCGKSNSISTSTSLSNDDKEALITIAQAMEAKTNSNKNNKSLTGQSTSSKIQAICSKIQATDEWKISTGTYQLTASSSETISYELTYRQISSSPSIEEQINTENCSLYQAYTHSFISSSSKYSEIYSSLSQELKVTMNGTILYKNNNAQMTVSNAVISVLMESTAPFSTCSYTISYLYPCTLNHKNQDYTATFSGTTSCTVSSSGNHNLIPKLTAEIKKGGSIIGTIVINTDNTYLIYDVDGNQILI